MAHKNPAPGNSRGTNTSAAQRAASDWSKPAPAAPRPAPAPRPAATQAAARRPASSWSRKGRMGANLIGLTSAAVAAVYAVGYINTRSAEDQLTAQAGASELSSAATAATSAPTVIATRPVASAPAASGSTVRPAATPTAAVAGYRDGTYTGTGSSRHGDITVSLVVTAGKIDSVTITSCRTRYPCSQISSLRAEVLTRQSAKIDHVSGATDSSTAYRTAVAAALAKAA